MIGKVRNASKIWWRILLVNVHLEYQEGYGRTTLSGSRPETDGNG
jgi:hypothetical protein